MNTEFEDPECPLYLMKTQIDKKLEKIMSLLNVKHNFQIGHRRTQTQPQQSVKDEDSTVVGSKEPQLSVKLLIPDFPLTSRNDTAIKQKNFNKTYTSRETLNRRRPNNSYLNTTNSTVVKTPTDIGKANFEVKLQKRIPKPQENLKKKKVEQPIIPKQPINRVKIDMQMGNKLIKQIEKSFLKNRDQNQDTYIRRLKLLERIAKRTENQTKK